MPDSLWEELTRWAARRGFDGAPVFLGIGHDSPAATPPHLLRFDAAIHVPGKFAPEGRIAHQVLPGGVFAVTTHAGHYATLPAAYRAVFPRLMRMKNYRVVGLPAIEVYHTTKVNQNLAMNHTDIYIPVAASLAE